MKKSMLKTVFVVSGILTLVCAAIALSSILRTLGQTSGIIGGAGMPTLRFSLEKAATPLFLGGIFCFLSLGTGLALVLGRKSQRK